MTDRNNSNVHHEVYSNAVLYKQYILHSYYFFKDGYFGVSVSQASIQLPCVRTSNALLCKWSKADRFPLLIHKA